MIDTFQREGQLRPEKMIQQENPNIGKLLANILLEEEEYQLHDWRKKNIFVKDRKSVVGQLVSETILTFRRHLVDQKIQNLMTSAQDEVPETKEIEFLEEVMQYQNLKKLLSRKLNRVL